MTTLPWQRAHVAILEHAQLPVRTHRRPPDPALDEEAEAPRYARNGHTRSPAAAAARREQIRALHARGQTVADISARMKLCERSVEIHLLALSQEKP